MPESSANVVTRTKINTKVIPPTLYSVVYLNDEKTSAVFVAETLIRIFNFDIESAAVLTEEISTTGSGVAAENLTKEIATHLTELVLRDAQLQNYPLRVEVRAE
jgi:ATP-dependent Clp protease adaptor protein ClpS